MQERGLSMQACMCNRFNFGTLATKIEFICIPVTHESSSNIHSNCDQFYEKLIQWEDPFFDAPLHFVCFHLLITHLDLLVLTLPVFWQTFLAGSYNDIIN